MVGRLGGVRHPVREGHRLGEVVESIALVQGAGLLSSRCPATPGPTPADRRGIHRVAAYRGIVRFSHAPAELSATDRDHRDPQREGRTTYADIGSRVGVRHGGARADQAGGPRRDPRLPDRIDPALVGPA
jgi:hypothetical protein